MDAKLTKKRPEEAAAGQEVHQGANAQSFKVADTFPDHSCYLLRRCAVLLQHGGAGVRGGKRG